MTTPKKIFIVEDDKMLIQLFDMFAKECGYEVVSYAQSSNDAIEKLKTVAPDVILMDIHLKGEADGLQTARIIHQFYDLPVVYISSDREEETVQRMIFANTYGFLVKPIYRSTLGIIIKLAYYKHFYDKALDIKERLKCAAIDISQEPIFVICDGKIEYSSCAALVLLKAVEVEDAFNKNIYSFIHPDFRENFIARLDEGFKENKEIEYFVSKLNALDNITEVDVSVFGSVIEFKNKKAIQLTFNEITSKL